MQSDGSYRIYINGKENEYIGEKGGHKLNSRTSIDNSDLKTTLGFNTDKNIGNIFDLRITDQSNFGKYLLVRARIFASKFGYKIVFFLSNPFSIDFTIFRSLSSYL